MIVDPSGTERRDRIEQEIQKFSAAAVHDLRTPLSALSGEVELALRRDRSPAGYREVLSRIGERVVELVDVTADLALLGHPPRPQPLSSSVVELDALLGRLAERSTPGRGVDIAITAGVRVLGDGALLGRALTLLADHALRHCRDEAGVRIRITPPGDAPTTSTWVDLVLDASPPGFLPLAWRHLDRRGGDADQDGVHAPGLIRLRTAARIVDECGGALAVWGAGGSECVHIRLRRA